jgi:hypothetical protein
MLGQGHPTLNEVGDSYGTTPAFKGSTWKYHKIAADISTGKMIMNPWHFDGFGVPKFGDKIDTNHTNQRSRKDTQGGLWLAIHGLQMAREGRGADPQKDASKILQFVYVYVLHVETIASRLDIAYLLVHLIFVGEPHSQQVGRAFAVIKQLSI